MNTIIIVVEENVGKLYGDSMLISLPQTIKEEEEEKGEEKKKKKEIKTNKKKIRFLQKNNLCMTDLYFFSLMNTTKRRHE